MVCERYQQWLLREETLIATRERIDEAEELRSTRSFPLSLGPTSIAQCSTHACDAGHLAHTNNHGPGGVVFHRHREGLLEALSSTRESTAKAVLPITNPPGFDDVPDPTRCQHFWRSLHLTAEWFWEQVRLPVTLVLGYGLLGSQTFPPRKKREVRGTLLVRRQTLKSLRDVMKRPAKKDHRVDDKDNKQRDVDQDADDDGGDFGGDGDGDGGD